MRRVVITGLGMVSPLGSGVEHNWSEITAGKSGISRISGFNADDLSSQIAGQVPRTDRGSDAPGALNPEDTLPAKEQRKIDDFILYALAASDEAFADCGWKPETEAEQDRTGVMIGAGIGGLRTTYEASITLHEKGPRRISPFTVPAELINLASGQVSIRHKLRGPNHSVVTACASGTHAIGDAARMIMLDDADVMVTGGAEAAVNRFGVACFAAAKALCTAYNDTPEAGSRPWDQNRDGFVIAEGAGILILEEYEHAKKRGAHIYGEIVGYGMSGDAYHITSPAEDGSGGYRAMQAALKRAQMNPEDIDYINAHGTSTQRGDGIEAGAVARLFANSLDTLTMSSTKSSIGHLLGAAGAVEAIYAIKAMQTGILPPTLNLENPDEDIAHLNLVPKAAQEKKVNAVLSNSFGFGGTNATLIFKRV